MTVKELIELLSRYDGDTPIVVPDDEGLSTHPYCSDFGVGLRKMKQEAIWWGPDSSGVDVVVVSIKVGM